MSDVPFPLLLLIVSLVGAAIVAGLPRDRADLAKRTTLGFSLVILALAVVMAVGFEPGGDRLQFTTSYSWIPDFGVSFSLGVDGIALVMIVLTALLVPIVVAASWRDEAEPEAPRRRSTTTYFAWLLVLEVFMIGVFAATDVFLFYIFFEAMLVPMYFIIGSFGGPRRQYAAVKFFLYSLAGGLVMLAAVIGLYVVSADQLGDQAFSWNALRQIDIDPTTQIWLFLGFFIAFAIKAPLVPLHTWLPDAGAEAPIGGAVLLVGILDKVGTFGFLRYNLPLFPQASQDLAPLVLTLAVIGILYGALLAIGQKDIKRLVAYTSIAHFGFIALGVFAFTTQGGTGAVLYMVTHGITTGMLFLVVGMLIARGGSRQVGDYGGVAKVAPLLAGVFLIAGLSSLALPGTNSFVSEFLVLLGTFSTQTVFAIIATVGIILAALYILIVYQRTMHGPIGVRVESKRSAFRDLNKRELAIVSPLVALIFVLGIYPKPVLDIINPAVQATLVDDVGVSDPLPSTVEAGK